MTAPALVVDTATGVSLSLPIAGPGARALAFILDFGIRGALATAWYAVAAILYHGRLYLAAPVEPDATWFAAVVIPAAALYLLYHFVLEIVMQGRTPGKRMAGVRIVTTSGGTPGVGALLTRNIFRLVDSFPAVYSIGLIATLVTPRNQRIGDLAAGTLLVFDRESPVPHAIAARSAPIDPETLDLAADLLDRWNSLSAASRQSIARTLLERCGAAVTNDAREAELRETLARLVTGEPG